MLQKKTLKNKKQRKKSGKSIGGTIAPLPAPAPQLRGPCMFAPEMNSNPVFDFDGERGRAVK